MFKIGDFARINKVTIKALRHYDSLGLLKPKKIDHFTGYRYYEAEQIPRLNKILSLKEIGFSLEEIAGVLKTELSAVEFEALLRQKQLEILTRIKDEQEKLERVRFLIELYKKEDVFMNYDVVIKRVEEIKVASVRDFIPSYSEQGHLWEELVGYIEKHLVKMTSPCMVIYHNEGSGEDRVDAEIIEPIAGELPESERIRVKNLPVVEEMACVVHVGPFNTLSMAYAALMKYVGENKYKAAGPVRELYLKGEWATEDPSEYITELQLPVQKMGK